MFEFGTTFWLSVFAYSTVFAYATSYIASQKGKEKEKWFLIGFILGIIGLLIVGFSKDESIKSDDKTKSEKNIKDYYNSTEANDVKVQNPTTNFSCPVDILWYSVIAYDSCVIAHSEFKNISEKEISSIIFAVECFNSFNNPVSENNVLEETIQDLEIIPGEKLKEEVVIDLCNLPATRKINIIIKNVLFNDGEIWVHHNDLASNEFKIINSSDLDILKKINGDEIISYSEQKHDRWICTCGRNNLLNADVCVRCNRKKETVLIDFSADKVEQTIKEYNDKMELEEKALAEKKVADMRKFKIKKAKRLRRLIISAVFSIFIFLIYYLTQVFLPSQRVEKGLRLAEEEKYEEAIEILKRTNSEDLAKAIYNKEVLTNLITNRNYDLAEVLISNGMDINFRDIYYGSPILIATKNNDISFVEFLLEKGANPNLYDANSDSPLKISIENHNYLLTKLLLENGAGVNKVYGSGVTVMHIAVEKKDIETIKLLLEHDSDIGILDENGNTPLHIAATFDSLDIFDVLVGDTIILPIQVLIQTKPGFASSGQITKKTENKTAMFKTDEFLSSFNKSKSISLYDENNNMFYKGEFKNGKINGYGIEYTVEDFSTYGGDIIYKGFWEDGLWHGKGDEYWTRTKIELLLEYNLIRESGINDYKRKYKNTVFRSTTYKLGVPDGEYVRYYQDGSLNDRGTIKNGEIIYSNKHVY